MKYCCSHLVLVAAFLATGCATEPPEVPIPALPPVAQPHVQAAQAALERGAFAAGLAHADSAALLAPTAPEVHFVRGRLFFELGRLDEAEAAYERVAAVAPGYEGLWHNMGNVSFQERRYRKALARYRREVTQHPAARPWHGMAGTYWTLGVADSARWAYEQAIAADPRYAPAHAGLADWYETEGAYDQALPHARQALTLAPDDPAHRYRVGALLFRTGAAAEAVPLLEAVAEARPWHYSARFTLGQALQQLGRPDEARTRLDEASRIRSQQAEVERLQRNARDLPEDFQVQVDYADALRRTGRLDEALRAYHVAQHLRPDHLALRNNIATIYLQRGDTAEALARYRRILADDSTFAQTWLNLGLHYARSGQPDEARAAFQTALRVAPDDPAVKSFIRRMRQQ